MYNVIKYKNASKKIITLIFIKRKVDHIFTISYFMTQKFIISQQCPLGKIL